MKFATLLLHARQRCAAAMPPVARSPLSGGHPPLGASHDWLDQNEQALEGLLEQVPLAPSKGPNEQAAQVGVIRGPRSTGSWANFSGQLRTTRTISNSGQIKNIGFLYSHTSGGMMPVESTLEFAAGILLDWSLITQGLHSQTDPVTYRLDGATRKTTPDFGFRLADGSRHCVEVKPLRRACTQQAQDRFEAIAMAAAASGRRYHVMTERVACREPRASHLRKLRHCASYPVTAADQKRLLGALSQSPDGITVGQLRDSVSESDWQVMQPCLLALLYWRLIGMDWTRSLDADARIWSEESPQ